MTKRFRCHLGLHSYQEIARKSRVGSIDECKHCGKQRVWAEWSLDAPEIREELGVKEHGKTG